RRRMPSRRVRIRVRRRRILSIRCCLLFSYPSDPRFSRLRTQFDAVPVHPSMSPFPLPLLCSILPSPFDVAL
ncbi:hypothetical protein PENTCL1PPCAC_11477, partial [Pristionchus entomophagus]